MHFCFFLEVLVYGGVAFGKSKCQLMCLHVNVCNDKILTDSLENSQNIYLFSNTIHTLIIDLEVQVLIFVCFFFKPHLEVLSSPEVDVVWPFRIEYHLFYLLVLIVIASGKPTHCSETFQKATKPR